MLSNKHILEALVLATIFAAIIAPIMPVAAVVQYKVLASYDFLNADEVSSFDNMTLAADNWNTTLTSYSISNGILNITNKDTSDALLVLDKPLSGYAEVKFAGTGEIIVFTGNITDKQGFVVERTSSGIVVYLLNGTSKTSLASISTTQDTVEISLMNGEFSVYLADGTQVYNSDIGSVAAASIALGAPASDGTNAVTASIDKIALYGFTLAGTAEIDLGTKTVTASARVAKFDYDVSSYSNIQTAKLVITFTPADGDPYARIYVVSTTDPGNDWATWSPDNSLSTGAIIYGGTIEVDVTDVVKNNPTGSFYAGISVGGSYSWSISAKLVLDADTSTTSTTTQTSTELPNVGHNIDWGQYKYLLIGGGAVVLLALIIALANTGGRRRRGLAALLAVFIFLLVIGGIAIAVMAWLHPEYLTAMAFGLGAIAVLVLLVMVTSGKRIPNPVKR